MASEGMGRCFFCLRVGRCTFAASPPLLDECRLFSRVLRSDSRSLAAASASSSRFALIFFGQGLPSVNNGHDFLSLYLLSLNLLERTSYGVKRRLTLFCPGLAIFLRNNLP